jgi:putative DNA methylase
VRRSSGGTLLDEGDLPLIELARLAKREGRRPRPIYQTHKWFARRFGSAFRALLVAAVSPASSQFWDAYDGGVDLTGMRVRLGNSQPTG